MKSEFGAVATNPVHAGVLKQLYAGTLVPGQRLVEADLIAMFHSSRRQVREALLRLESEGLVENIPFRGARIRSFGQREARDIVLTMTAHIALAARQAAEHIAEGRNREDLAAAMNDLRQYDEAAGYFSYAAARERFYRLIIDIAGNEEIKRICPLMQGHIVQRHLWAGYNLTIHHKRLPYFQAIHDAIAERKGKEAEAAVWAFHEAGEDWHDDGMADV